MMHVICFTLTFGCRFRVVLIFSFPNSLENILELASLLLTGFVALIYVFSEV
jgi:hypothetical protein